jgi:hypothetical protein
MGRIRDGVKRPSYLLFSMAARQIVAKTCQNLQRVDFSGVYEAVGAPILRTRSGFVGICGSCSLVAIRSFRRRLRQPTKSDICILMGPALPIRHGLAHGSFWSLPSASLRLHVLSSLSTFIRSLTWIFSSERTAFLIFWRDFSVALPAASLSNFASISLQVKGRFEPPG